ncbi:MAG: DEAD/DEAH box helicase [Spirochaetota bacterium]
MKFEELELHQELKKTLSDQGFIDLTPIQEKSLPYVMEGRDLTGLAQTGTGKTLCFLLPILNYIYSQAIDGHTALILAPTRELVLQICEEAEKLLKNTPHKVASIIGGVGYKSQEKELKEKAAILVATPGRLIDHMKSGKIDMSQIKYFVLDEADRMFDMGFVKDIRYIMKLCPKDKQTLLFSATMSYYVLRIASDYLDDAIQVRVEPEKVTTDNIEQFILHLGKEEKLPHLVNMIQNECNEGLGIIFTNLKAMVPEIVYILRKYGIAATGISSSLDQKKRVRLLKQFKLGKFQYMVATDVASRGLDVDDINYVFNFDLPEDTESYVHRIGRTARAGRTGKSFSFCSERDYTELEKIQTLLKRKIDIMEINESYLEFPQPNPIDPNEAPPKRERKERFQRNNNHRGKTKPRREHAKQGTQNHKEKNTQRKSKLNKYQKEKLRLDSVDQAKEFVEKADSVLQQEKPHKKRSKKKQTGRQENIKPNKNDNAEQVDKQYDKSKRNLFDINDQPAENQKPKTIWKRIRSFFGG